MISTAGTVCEAARLVMEKGADRVIAAATHGVLVGLALERLMEAPIEQVLITDTIANGDRLASLEPKLHRLSVAPLLGEAVHRIHHDMSVSSLFQLAAGTKR